MHDQISGAWSAGPVVLFLRYDGSSRVSGRLAAGGLKTVGMVSGTFDATTGLLRFAGDVRDPRNGQERHVTVEGTLRGDTLRV